MSDKRDERLEHDEERMRAYIESAQDKFSPAILDAIKKLMEKP